MTGIQIKNVQKHAKVHIIKKIIEFFWLFVVIFIEKMTECLLPLSYDTCIIKEIVGKVLMINNQKKAGNLCPTFRL